MSDKIIETAEVDPGMSVVPEAGITDVPTIIPELDSVLAAVPSALPDYVTTAWKDKPSTATPVTAEIMTRVEQRLVDLTKAVNALRDSVSHMGYVRCGMVILEAGKDEAVSFEVPFPSGMSYGGVAMVAPMSSSHDNVINRSVQVMAASRTSIVLKALSSDQSTTQIQVRWLAVAY